MCSRLIIEQRIADLELALSRQEELILLQRNTLNGLKELIYAEARGNDYQIPSPVVRPSNNISFSATGGVIPRTNSSQSRTLNVSQPPLVLNSSYRENGIAAFEPESLNDSGEGESARKKPRTNEPALQRGRNQSEMGTTNVSRSSPIVIINPPLVPKTSLSWIPKSFLPRRKRALEKVKVLLARLPPLLAPSNNNVSGTATSQRPTPFSNGIRLPVTASMTPTIPVSQDLPHALPKPIPIRASEPPPQVENFISTVPTHSLLRPHDVHSDLSRLRDLTAEDARIDTARFWNNKIKNGELEQCRNFLISGGKEMFVSWLNDMNAEEYTPKKETNEYIDNLLNSLSKIEWTPDDISESRFDKTLRRLYKKLFPIKNIVENNVLQHIKTLWTQYRTMYNITKEMDE